MKTDTAENVIMIIVVIVSAFIASLVTYFPFQTVYEIMVGDRKDCVVKQGTLNPVNSGPFEDDVDGDVAICEYWYDGRVFTYNSITYEDDVFEYLMNVGGAE